MKVVIKKWIELFCIGCMALSIQACSPMKSEVDLAEELETYSQEVSQVKIDEKSEFTFEASCEKDKEYIEAQELMPTKTGKYKVHLTIPKEKKSIATYYILDSYLNVILTLDSKTLEGELDLVYNENYYGVLVLETKNKKETKLSATVSFEDTGKEIQVEELIDSLSTEFTGDGTNIARFTPKQDGYYIFYTDAKVETGIVAIYSILDKEGNVLDSLENSICELEKGKDYYIVYGVEETMGNKSKVDLYVEYLDQSLLDQIPIVQEDAVLELTGPALICFDSQKEQSMLVYSISKEDLKGQIYNEDFEIVAENDDANKKFSENEKDFAMILHAKKGQTYLVYVDARENVSYKVHFEMKK
ncbi:MAG: hypothetical protein Q4C49_09630 [Bacillota bacterium]|nr:hypothetical protein [Bacillota bacterium]